MRFHDRIRRLPEAANASSETDRAAAAAQRTQGAGDPRRLARRGVLFILAAAGAATLAWCVFLIWVAAALIGHFW